MVVVPSQVINKVRQDITAAIHSKDIVVIKTAEGLTSDVSIPVPGRYRIAANVITNDFLGTLGLTAGHPLGIILENRDLKEVEFSNKKGELWIESGPIKLDKGKFELSLLKKGEGEVRLRKFVLYKADNSINSIEKLFETKEVNNPVVWEQINPTKYRVKFKTEVPTYLMLSEGFDPRWILNFGDRILQSIPAYSLINSFFIAVPGEIEATLEFSPQRYMYQGLWVSGIGLGLICGCLFCAGAIALKKRNGRW